MNSWPGSLVVLAQATPDPTPPPTPAPTPEPTTAPPPADPVSGSVEVTLAPAQLAELTGPLDYLSVFAVGFVLVTLLLAALLAAQLRRG